jgi:arylamine N-acetyltransferase
LRAAGVHQEPFDFELRPSPAPGADWQFVHDPRGSFFAMAFRTAPAAVADFESDHRHLSTSPESGFVRTLTVQRRDDRGVDVIRARTRTRRDADGSTSEVLGRAEWFDTLRDMFGLDLSDLDDADRGRLWSAVSAQHDRHVAENP